MAHDVFISYSAQDKSTADAVCAKLEQNGIRCWIAPRDILPGMEYADALVEALHGSRLLVLVFSSAANASVQVHQEVERAVSRGRVVLPFRIEDVPPDRAMEFFIAGRHWLDALTPPLEAHLDELVRTVKLLLARSDAKAGGAQSALTESPKAQPEAWANMRAAPQPAAPRLPALPRWLDMSRDLALRHMRNAWIAGLVSAAMTLVMALIVIGSGEESMTLGGLEVGYLSLIDVVAILVFCYGVYRHGRWAAIGLLVWFTIGKLVQIEAAGLDNPIALGFAALFFYYYIQGVRGASAFKAMEAPPHAAAA